MRKFLITLLAAAICMSLFMVPSAAAASNSTSNNQAEAAAVLQMMGALQGDENGSLNLSDTLTRSQFCKIAVVVMGYSGKVSQYTGYTIFPDVTSTGWEAGYVNLAVRLAGIMSGYTNGYFGPDDTITYGQAVTVIMRILGYTSSVVGANWPDDYIYKAKEIGLTTGLGYDANSAISRGDAALLFANMLVSNVYNTNTAYAGSISGTTTVKNVFLISNNAKTDDGTTGAVKVAGASGGTYLPANSVPKALVGKFGTLVLNSSGKALTFVPANTGKTVSSSVSSVTSSVITCSDGTKISMTSSPTFYLDGAAASYSAKWYSITSGMLVSAYYSDGGSVRYVVVTTPDTSSGSVTVVSTGSYTPASSTALIYKNGSLADASDVCMYDVVTYDPSYNVYNVTDSKITGRYESAYPNDDTPSTVTVLGAEYEVLDTALASLSNFSIGDYITLLLTQDNKVAGAVGGIGSNIGIVTSMTSTSATVKLLNGITVSGSLSSKAMELYNNMLVNVYSGSTGYITLSTLSQTSNSSLNLKGRTLGDAKLSPWAVIYDSVGGSSLVKVSEDDITMSTVSGSKIYFVGYDQSGNVNLIVLNDVTGDAYTYGLIKKGTSTKNSNGISVTNNTVSVSNSSGTITYIGNTALSGESYGGVAADGNSIVKTSISLTETAGLVRSNFIEDESGNIFVTIGSETIPVSGNVQAYIYSKGTWTTLSNARAFSNNLTALYDKSASEGGKVRIVIAY